METQKKIEFSKLIFWLVWATNLMVILFAMAMMIAAFKLTGYFDSTPLIYLIPSTATELAASTAFYYWKAKAENKIKIALSSGVKIDENTIYSFIS